MLIEPVRIFFTCKSDDVQRYTIHSSENICCHAVGWTLMNLRLPKFTYLLAFVKNTYPHGKRRNLTWSAFSLKIGISERICAGPNAGFYSILIDWIRNELKSLTMMRRWKKKTQYRSEVIHSAIWNPTNLFLVRRTFGKNETYEGKRRDFIASARKKIAWTQSDRSYLLPKVSKLFLCPSASWIHPGDWGCNPWLPYL